MCLDQYMENLRMICTHETVKAHSPRLIIITPPPVNEYKMEATDLQKGHNGLQRTAELTKKYANAARQVGEALKIPVLDLWTIFMTRAGWVAGEPLPGCRGVERNGLIEELMYDGKWACQQIHRSRTYNGTTRRATLDTPCLQDRDRGAHESDCLGVPRPDSGEASICAPVMERLGSVGEILMFVCCAASRCVRGCMYHSALH